jgi:ornithine cyclodeaminase/alanine dehydrogenase-like protein (mu-crystallin family)
MKSAEPLDTLIVTRRDIMRLVTSADYLAAAEQAFRAAMLGKANAPHPMHLPMMRGGFHAKGASMSLDRDYVAIKMNGNFPSNPTELGLPTIQGAILLCDGRNGRLLAVMDSIELTLRRTAAASALAARLLARPESETVLVCGCGEQGRAHAEALREVLPVRRYLFWDLDQSRSERLAAEFADGNDLEARAAHRLESHAKGADVIVCCTTSKEPYLGLDQVNPGTFIAAVGADSPDKSEISPDLMASSIVVTDVLAQCIEMGDLHHAIDAGLMSKSDVHAELGEVLTGAKKGRSSADQIIIFDSTGAGFQDVAAAAAIYDRCGADVRSIELGAEP